MNLSHSINSTPSIKNVIYIKFGTTNIQPSEKEKLANRKREVASAIALYRYTLNKIQPKKTLRILMLSDGIPGHANQSRGLINWLASRYKIEVQVVDVKLKFKALSRQLLPRILHHSNNTKLVTSFYDHSTITLENPELIISMGGNTSFLNIALARQLSIANIFIGSKRRLNSDDFSAHLTLSSTKQAHNIVMKIPPSLTDLTQLEKQGLKLRTQLKCAPNDKVYLMALGGDGAGYSYDKKSCEQLAQLMTTISEKENCKWLLTTSRRTGPDIEQALQSLLPAHLLLDTVWWSQSPRKVMNAYLGAAERLFISIDSISMISEAIASGKPTLSLQPDTATPNKRYQQTLKRYCDMGYCSIHPLRDSTINSINTVTTPLLSAREALLDELSPLLEKTAQKIAKHAA